jgi:hypothetical protein
MLRTVYVGAGSDAHRLFRTMATEEEVIYFVDNDPARHGRVFLGREIRPPSALLAGDYDRVRIVCGATWDVFRQLRALGIPADRIVADLVEPRNLAFLETLPGKHAGRRAFIVGNGPSLLVADLERIHETGDIAFAFNKIYLAFGDTRFRPTYYMVDDLIVAENNADAISALKGFPKLFPDAALRYITKDPETYVFGMRFQDGTAPVSLISETPLELCSGWTVAYTALQMALLMGCDPVCLIGMDFSYAEPAATHDGDKVLCQSDERNHFHPGYRLNGERWLRPNLDFARRSFESARELARRKGVRILNATRGGQLDVFERVAADALFDTRTTASAVTAAPNDDPRAGCAPVWA